MIGSGVATSAAGVHHDAGNGTASGTSGGVTSLIIASKQRP